VPVYDVTKEGLVGSFGESEESLSDQKHDGSLNTVEKLQVP
jgi:hypothetical protein